jgi:Ran GTPase-activating protein (RanGAP) involved in mRNA processing and transport
MVLLGRVVRLLRWSYAGNQPQILNFQYLHVIKIMICNAGHIPQMPNLHHLDISHNPLNSEGGEHLRAWLSPAHRTLRTLVLSHTDVGDAGAASLAGLLTAAPLMCLQALDLSHCQVSARGVEEIMHAATHTALPALETLSLSHNPLEAVRAHVFPCHLSNRILTLPSLATRRWRTTTFYIKLKLL